MSSKKNKNKRAKVVSASVSDIQSEVSIKVEEIISKEQGPTEPAEICPENSSCIIAATEESIQQHIPVKPKRKKGKKKKHEDSNEGEVIKLTEVIQESKLDTLNIEEQLDSQSDRENEVKPTSRKKKKNKKKTEKLSTEASTEFQQPIQEDIIPVERVSTPNQEPILKKKNKKKKNSESTKSEDVACVSAFKKLLDAEEFQDELHLSDSSCADALLPDESKKTESEHATKQNNKKKRKKDKKHTCGETESIEREPEQEPSIVVVDIVREGEVTLLECETSESIKEESPKPKAKIVKPVDKKRKDKTVIIKDNTDTKNTSLEVIDTANKALSSNEEDKKDTQKIILRDKVNTDDQPNVVKLVTNLNTDSSPVKSEPLIHGIITTASHEQDIKLPETVICQETNSSQDNVDSVNTPYTEVRPSRKKKRTGKNIDVENTDQRKCDISIEVPTVSVDLQSNSNLKTIEDTNITPDFIYYPRSSSQQQFDSNNNMVIREINSPDEVRLGIPILMSIPVIQGSGESPEVRSKIDPLDLEVSEIHVATKNASESTDIISKINEESQVMVQLQSSIEKSLAELTALEKSELDAEKEFAEVLAYNLKSVVTQDETLKPETNIALPVDECPQPISKKKHIDENVTEPCSPPAYPARKDKKGKSKRKAKKGSEQNITATSTSNTSSDIQTSDSYKSQESSKKDDKGKTSESQENKGKQQSLSSDTHFTSQESFPFQAAFEPIENFEDALTSSTEDINDTFELIAKEASENIGITQLIFQKPEISITEPEEDKGKKKNAKESPLSQPKNLLGQPNIPVQSNKTDYKKEKNKPPSTMTAKVKVKDATEIEKSKQSKESQTKNKLIKQTSKEFCTFKTNENDDFVYKYSFRKVFLPNICHVCKKELSLRVSCKFCNLLFYCSQKHKDEDWPQHQFLCFAVSTIAHLKEQKFIYGDAKNVTGQEYRILRMQIIMSCEKMLKRKLVPWEQEALLYPRVCSNVSCREWKQGLLSDCKGCGQAAFCSAHPEHLPISHQRWCKSYALYQKLVCYQQSQGRLEPRLPSKVLCDNYQIPENMNEVLALLFEEKIDMSDIQYAALTQIATAPLTAAYSYQISKKGTNGFVKPTAFSIHIVGAELQFEADVLNKWEIFFLHLKPNVRDLRVVLISSHLNPSNLPLDLLTKIKLCELCRASSRRLLFNFEDKKTYQDYYNSEEFILPDIVCAFNTSIERASVYNGRDHWPSTIACISKLKSPLLLTAHTLNELIRDLTRVKMLSKFNVISEPKYNSFASVRPDRNFITDDEMPLSFKNYCYSVVCGA